MAGGVAGAYQDSWRNSSRYVEGRGEGEVCAYLAWRNAKYNTYQGKYYDKGEQKPYIHFLRTAHLYSTKHSPNSLLSSHFTRISIRIRACKLLGAVCMYMTYSGHSA